MQIILLEKVLNVGQLGEVVKVKDGYARNFLIPQGIAKAGTSSNLNEANQAREAKAYHDEQERLKAVELGKIIEKTTLNLKVKCGANGKVFGSVTNKEISEELAKLNISVDKKKIETDTIKSIGLYDIKVKLHPTVVVKLKVNIES